MPLNLEQKKELVKEVSDVLLNADTILTADYRGLTANQLSEFRKIARTPGIYIKIVKNNMLKMALKDSEYANIGDKIIGPQILATATDNPGEFAKLVKKFIDNNENIELKSLAYKGKELDLSEIKKLASLPTYEEAISMLMSIPTIIASGSVTALDLIEQNFLLTETMLVILFSFFSALLALSLMMRLLHTLSYTPYVIYRIILGLFLLIIGYTGGLGL